MTLRTKFILTSGHKDAIRKTKDARRFFVIDGKKTAPHARSSGSVVAAVKMANTVKALTVELEKLGCRVESDVPDELVITVKKTKGDE